MTDNKIYNIAKRITDNTVNELKREGLLLNGPPSSTEGELRESILGFVMGEVGDHLSNEEPPSNERNKIHGLR